jgi:hypothetical protein
MLQACLMIPMAEEVHVKCFKIANRRIYIEQAIRRLKYFRILKYELPVTLNQHLDYIMKSVAGKCNRYPPLIKYN